MSKEDPIGDHCLYFDISTQERDSAIRYLLGIILNARRDGKFPSNYYTYDEDVNVYLAHLLFANSLPEYHEMARPYLSLDSSQILKWVRATEDRTIRYFIFKVNADHILIHSAVFDDLEGHRRHHPFMRRSDKHYRELARLYYDQATAYHKRMYRRHTGVGEVLQKISDYFEHYQGLLQEIRRQYFGFVNSFRDQVFNLFVKDLKHYEGNLSRRTVLDQFLDAYGRWLANKDPRLVPAIRHLAEKLKQLDPEFRFDVERELEGRGGTENERQAA